MFLGLPVEKIAFIAIACLGFIIAVITVVGKRIGKYKARYMGIPLVVFAWMNAVYGLVLFEGVSGIVSTVMDWSIWVDISIMLVILLLCMAIFFKLTVDRNKFKPELFIALFLIPCSIPGIGTIGKVISKAPVQEVVKYGEPAIDVLKKEGGIVLENLGQQTSEAIDAIRNIAKGSWTDSNVPKIPPVGKIPSVGSKGFPKSIPVPGSGYAVKFSYSHQVGDVGDALTNDWFTRRIDGYSKLESKIDKIHGIDGVYVKQVGSKIKDIRVIENKVRTDGAASPQASLQKDQMKRAWINTKITEMISSNDSEVRKTGEFLRKNRSLVSPELWHYNLRDPEKSSFSALNSNAMIRHETTKYLPSEFIEEYIRKKCRSKSLTCEKL